MTSNYNIAVIYNIGLTLLHFGTNLHGAFVVETTVATVAQHIRLLHNNSRGIAIAGVPFRTSVAGVARSALASGGTSLAGISGISSVPGITGVALVAGVPLCPCVARVPLIALCSLRSSGTSACR